MCRHRLVNVRRFVTIVGLVAATVLNAQVALASTERADALVHSTLQLDVDARRGSTVFAQHCARCHGNAAVGDAAKGIPALAGQRKSYLVKQLADFLERDRAGAAMHGVVSQQAIAEPQVWADVANFLSNLTPQPAPATGDGGQLQLGEAIFRDQCASCHADDGRGDDDGFVPSLRNQHYPYLVQQIRSISRWHRANVESDLVLYLDSLSADETLAVADYLSRLSTPVRDRVVLQPDGTLKDAGDQTQADCKQSVPCTKPD